MNFDESLKNVEQIVVDLSQDLPMEQAVEKYQQGVQIIKECLNSLETAKGQVFKVKQDLDAFLEEKMK